MDGVVQQRLVEARDATRSGLEQLECHDTATAVTMFHRAAQLLRLVMSLKDSDMEKDLVGAVVRTLDAVCESNAVAPSEDEDGGRKTADKDQGGAADDEGGADFLKSVLKRPEDITQDWASIVGNADALNALHQAVFLPSQLPHLFHHSNNSSSSSSGCLRPWRVLLLYGPPGTGKTMLAHAVAREANTPLVSLTASNLLSKWLGESERCVRVAFDAARRSQRCILFFDEIDALFHDRGGGSESESARRVKTEFLVRLQELLEDPDATGTMMLAATNMPWDLDPAFRRRFEQMIYVPLPDAAAREKYIGDNVVGGTTVTPEDVHDLAEQMDGYSCSDIRNVLRHAAMAPVVELQRCRHFRLDMETQTWHPAASAEVEGAVEMSLTQLPRGGVVPRPMSVADLRAAMDRYPRSVSLATVSKYTQWQEQHRHGQA
eukprot:PhM_4_TR5836/c0_g1_i1/m.79645/K12196/VPS4; vacuolar protein-sorting-associated protein 4